MCWPDYSKDNSQGLSGIKPPPSPKTVKGAVKPYSSICDEVDNVEIRRRRKVVMVRLKFNGRFRNLKLLQFNPNPNNFKPCILLSGNTAQNLKPGKPGKWLDILANAKLPSC